MWGLALLFAVLPAVAAAEPSVSLRGHAMTTAALPFRGYEMLSLRPEIAVDASVREGPWRGVASAAVAYEAAHDQWDTDEGAAQFEPKDIYAAFRGDRVEVFGGLRSLGWGATEGYTVVDILNPADPSAPFANGRSTNRKAVPMLGGNWSWDGTEAAVVVIPRAGVSGLPKAGNRWMAPDLARQGMDIQRLAYALSRDRRPDRPEYALRIVRYGREADMGISYFEGFADDPLLFLNVSGEADAVYPRYRQLAVEGARQTDRGLWKAEAGFAPRVGFLSTGGEVRHASRAVASLSWESVVGDATDLIVQGYARFMPDTPAGAPAGTRRGAGLSYVLSDSGFDDDRLTLGVRGLHELRPSSGMHEIFAVYDVSDDIEIEGALTVYVGAEGFGGYSRNSAATFSVRRYF
jgi:hypothetical protein